MNKTDHKLMMKNDIYSNCNPLPGFGGVSSAYYTRYLRVHLSLMPTDAIEKMNKKLVSGQPENLFWIFLRSSDQPESLFSFFLSSSGAPESLFSFFLQSSGQPENLFSFFLRSSGQPESLFPFFIRSSAQPENPNYKLPTLSPFYN